jgi:hypothetical protein
MVAMVEVVGVGPQWGLTPMRGIDNTRPDTKAREAVIPRYTEQRSSMTDRFLEPILYTIASYSASVVKIYSAANSMARFKNKNNFALM